MKWPGLRQANLKLKPSKCHFAQPTIQFLGHQISDKGVQMEKAKIQAILDFPVPKNVKQTRSC